jgi:hypothetical protein
MLTKVLALHVAGIVEVNGGVLYKDKPIITDIRGRIPAREGAVSNHKMIMVPSGTYVVLFEEQKPDDFDDDPNISYIIDQSDLMYTGMKLTLSPDKFIGLLEVPYSSQFELGAKLVTLKYVHNFQIPEDLSNKTEISINKD